MNMVMIYEDLCYTETTNACSLKKVNDETNNTDSSQCKKNTHIRQHKEQNRQEPIRDWLQLKGEGKVNKREELIDVLGEHTLKKGIKDEGKGGEKWGNCGLENVHAHREK